jgi:hypothetical protein
MRSAIALAAGALAGCQLVFPLEVEQLPPGATVSGTYKERLVTNTASGPSVIEQSAAGAVSLRARFVVDSEVRFVDVEIDGDGNFEIPRPAIEYTLESTFPTSVAEAVPIELFEDQAVLQLQLRRAGREAPEVVNLTSVTLPPSSATPPRRHLVTLGQYTNTPVTGAASIDWRSAKPIGGIEVGLLDGMQNDRAFVLEYTNARFRTGQTTISAFGSPASLAMMDGTPLDLMGVNLSPTANLGCVDVDFDLNLELARLDAAAKAEDPSFSNAAGNWALVSVPSIETGLAGGVSLVEASATLPVFELQDQLQYQDPFVDQVGAPLGHGQFFQAFAKAERSVLVEGALTTIGYGFSQTIRVEPSPCGDPSAVELSPVDVAYARDLAIDGQLLTADEVEVDVPRTGTVTLTWSAEGLADFYDVTLFEATAVGLVARRVFRTRTPQITFDATFLEPGAAYLFTVTSTVGFRRAGSGDYETATDPLITASASSAVFRPN